MSARRMLLEGEDLAALMARVRAEMGPGARIVKAERVRTGGVAGFFARERYELTVEVPDVPAAGRGARSGSAAPLRGTTSAAGGTTTPSAAPAGIEALLAAADAAEGAPRATDAGAGGGAPGTGARGAGPAGAGGADTGGASPEPPQPTVSTASPTFAEVLESMRRMVGPTADAAPDGAPDPTAARGTTPSATSATAPAGPPAGSAGAPHGTAGTAADDGAPDTSDGAPGSPEASAPPEVVDAVPEDAVPVDATPVAGPPRPGSGSSVTSLLELGVPTRLLSGFADPGAAVPLSVLVRRFDRPPSVRLLPGSVIAVVGPPDLALRTATQMAQRGEIDPHDIVLAGAMPPVAGHGRRHQTPSAVARLRARVPDDVPTVVAVGVTDEREGWADAAAVLKALTPHQAWGVVDARRKVVELRRWLRAVGAHRPLDALAACNTFDAQSPGTVLTLGTPVGWVDGLPATPVVWAAVLSERLTDDARWD